MAAVAKVHPLMRGMSSEPSKKQRSTLNNALFTCNRLNEIVQIPKDECFDEHHSRLTGAVLLHHASKNRIDHIREVVQSHAGG